MIGSELTELSWSQMEDKFYEYFEDPMHRDDIIVDWPVDEVVSYHELFCVDRPTVKVRFVVRNNGTVNIRISDDLNAKSSYMIQTADRKHIHRNSCIPLDLARIIWCDMVKHDRMLPVRNPSVLTHAHLGVTIVPISVIGKVG